MPYFLLLYLSIYSIFHFYVFRKIKTAFQPGSTGKTALAVFMIVMIMAPIIIHLTEKAGLEIGARFWAYISFSWMGLLFLFVMLAAVFDVALFIGRIIQKNPARPPISPRQLLQLEALLVFAIYGYGLFEATDIRLEQIELASPKITAQTGRIRIVQVSDIHLGLIISERKLNKIVAMIQQAAPDLLVSTGDLVDGQLNLISKEIDLLAAINPPLGKFAITGNHEFYAGADDALDFTKAAGFKILRQQGMTIGNINIVGVDDPAGQAFSKIPSQKESDLLARQPGDNFTILLKHRPVIDPDSLGLFDLQLSGHTHKGQIFPFNLITWLFYPQPAGKLTQLKSGFLYLSRGTGTWGPPIRFLAPPEITIIDLVPTK